MKRTPMLAAATAAIAMQMVFLGEVRSADARIPGIPFPPHIVWKSEKVTLPSSSEVFTGPGAKLLNTYCLMCHSADFVNEQPALPKPAWKAGVLKMKNVYGAPIPHDQIDALADVLYQKFGPPPAGR